MEQVDDVERARRGKRVREAGRSAGFSGRMYLLVGSFRLRKRGFPMLIKNDHLTQKANQPVH